MNVPKAFVDHVELTQIERPAADVIDFTVAFTLRESTAIARVSLRDPKNIDGAVKLLVERLFTKTREIVNASNQ